MPRHVERDRARIDLAHVALDAAHDARPAAEGNDRGLYPGRPIEHREHIALVLRIGNHIGW